MLDGRLCRSRLWYDLLVTQGAVYDRDLQRELGDRRVFYLEVDVAESLRQPGQLPQLETLRQGLAGVVQLGLPARALQ